MKTLVYPIAALVLCAPMMARAAEGFVVADISLQAGPDVEYPSITELAAGTPVAIEGCIDGWTWCDVIAGPDRGWVPGTFLQETYNGERVYIIDYGPRIGIPVVSFSINLYWTKYYQSRPFYVQREQWVTRAIQPREPPKPAAYVAAKSGAVQQPAIKQQRPLQPATRSTSTQSAKSTVRTGTKASEQPLSVAPSESAAARANAKAEPKPATPNTTAVSPKRATTTARTATPAGAPHNEVQPRKGEPKAKDELKKPTPKNDKEKDRENGGNSNG